MEIRKFATYIRCQHSRQLSPFPAATRTVTFYLHFFGFGIFGLRSIRIKGLLTDGSDVSDSLRLSLQRIWAMDGYIGE